MKQVKVWRVTVQKPDSDCGPVEVLVVAWNIKTACELAVGIVAGGTHPPLFPTKAALETLAWMEEE